jgi:PAS domain S-box-containing protein
MSMKKGTSGVFLTKMKPVPWALLLIFLLLLSAITASGYFYYQKQGKNVLQEQQAQLQAIADLKVAEIGLWLKERMGNARLIMENPLLSTELLAYLRNPAPGPRAQAIRDWMESLRRNYHYQNILLLGNSGEIILALNERFPFSFIGDAAGDALEATRRLKSVVVSDLHLSAEVPFPHLDLTVPLADENRITGFVLLRIDPAEYLYPLIQAWPTPSSSAETLLVRREGNDVLFLNELRHRKGTAMKLRLPIRDTELPATQAALGKTGIFTGRDYRGVAVWSSVRPVPGTAWSIVAKVDRVEIERPLRRSALAVILVIFSIILATAALVFFLWQRQSTRFRLRQLEDENQKQALVQHFDYLSRYANDIILLCDERWNIVEANERAMLSYGYNREELLKMNLLDLLVPAEREKLAGRMCQAQGQLGVIFETRQQRKDGSDFPVEISARSIVANDKKYFQGIVRDIGERQQAQQALMESELKFRSLFETMSLGVVYQGADGKIISANPAAEKILGLTLDQMQGRTSTDPRWKAIHEDGSAFPGGVHPGPTALRSGAAVEGVIMGVFNPEQENYRWIKVSAIPQFRPGESIPYQAFSTFDDVTSRINNEKALRESELKFRNLFNTMREGLALHQLIYSASGKPINYRIIDVNPAFERVLGIARTDAINSLATDLYTAPSPPYLEAYARVAETGQATTFETYFPPMEKHFRIVVFSPGSGFFATVFEDITERKQAEDALRESERQVSLIYDTVGDVIFNLKVEKDGNYRFISVNQCFLTTTGLQAGQIVGKRVQEVVPEPSLSLVLGKYAEAIRKKQIERWEEVSEYPTGRLIGEVSIAPVFDKTGNCVSLVGSVHDITERKRVEASLRESEDKFKYVFDNSVVGKSITLPNGEINVNRSFCDMLGYSTEEMKSRKWQELTHPDDIRTTQKMLDGIIAGEKDSVRFEKRYLHKNGSIVWADVSTALRRDADGKPLYFMTAVVDISERKQAEGELKSLSSRNQALLDAVPNIIMEVDANKVYTWANHAGIDFFGDDVIGREASFYFEGEQQTYLAVKPIFNGQEEVIYVESWQRRRDGEKRLLAWWCRALKDAAGAVTGALSSARDITEMKLAENEIRHLNEELEQRVLQRTAQLEAANKELEAFSYSVSHDLRAPLRAIDGFARIALEEYAPKLDKEGRRLLDVITANSRKMGQLIDDLLAFSRLSRQQMAAAPINLATMASVIFKELKNQEKGRRIEFKVGALPAAHGDHSMLQQVLQNLLANAVKFTRTKPIARIELSGKTDKGENVFYVKDNGVGFDTEYTDKLFGVFQRLHGVDEFEGTGVGLAIVKRVILRHGGRVWAESGAKGGATFFFTLPDKTTHESEASPLQSTIEKAEK